MGRMSNRSLRRPRLRGLGSFRNFARRRGPWVRFANLWCLRSGLGSISLGTRSLRRQLVEVIHLRADGSGDALDLGIRGFDDVIFVGRVRSVAMAEAEVASGETQR